MNKNYIIIAFLFTVLGLKAQNSERIKVDGVSIVIGKNIVLDSDIDKFKKELEQRTDGKVSISDCDALEEIMTQKLIAHHAVIDSIEVSDAEVEGEVDRNISYFKQQLGSMEKVVEYYGFSDEEDLRKELGGIQKEQLLIQRERASITDELDVTPEEVRTYFKSLEVDNNLPEFSAEVELAQIVKYIKPSEAETKRVVEKLNEIKAEVENGYSFRLKAIINSDDPEVVRNGGLYTLTRESGFIKEFKEVAFSLDEGEISEPFESGFGYHIIQVEKIKGQERDVRHVLLQPKITDEELKESLNELVKIRSQILTGEITFEEAVSKFSEDKDTKNNNGLLLNPETNDASFDLTRMDPTLFNRVSSLKEGDISEPFYEEVRGGEKMHKFILMKSKVDSHTAEFTKDYEKIQRLALQKKQEEAIEKWAKEKIDDTYIKINEEYKNCTFKKNWKKEQ